MRVSIATTHSDGHLRRVNPGVGQPFATPKALELTPSTYLKGTAKEKAKAETVFHPSLDISLHHF